MADRFNRLKAGGGCLKYCPPGRWYSSTTVTFAPARDAWRAAESPAGPAPTTAISVSSIDFLPLPEALLDLDLHPGLSVSHACAHVWHSVHCHQAVEADPHAAVDAAGGALSGGMAECGDSGGHQGARYGLAFVGRDRRAVDLDLEPLPALDAPGYSQVSFHRIASACYPSSIMPGARASRLPPAFGWTPGRRGTSHPSYWTGGGKAG